MAMRPRLLWMRERACAASHRNTVERSDVLRSSYCSMSGAAATAAARKNRQLGQPEEAQACSLHHRGGQTGAIWEGPGTGTPLWRAGREEARREPDPTRRPGWAGQVVRDWLSTRSARRTPPPGQSSRRQLSLPCRSCRCRCERPTAEPANSGQIKQLLFEDSAAST